MRVALGPVRPRHLREEVLLARAPFDPRTVGPKGRPDALQVVELADDGRELCRHRGAERREFPD